MADENAGSSGFQATAKNISHSNVVMGHHSHINAPQLTPAENEELAGLLNMLVDEIGKSDLDAKQKQEAVEKVVELESALTDEEEPDIGRVESVVRWFKRKAPVLVGAVLSVVVNPLVGQLVAAGGQELVEEFGRRFNRA